MTNRLVYVVSIVFVIWTLTIVAPADDDQVRPDPTLSGENALVLQLKDSRVEERRAAAKQLSEQRDAISRSLIEVVRGEGPVAPDSPRALAANLLGEWREVSQVPELLNLVTVRHIAYKSPLRDFYWDAYPIANAIVKMGPSALKPTLAELAKRTDPLTAMEVKVVSHIIVALCDESREEAMDAIARAEKQFGAKTELRRVHMHIEHAMDKAKELQRFNAVPKG